MERPAKKMNEKHKNEHLCYVIHQHTAERT